jgi:hypothetical protein
MYSGGIEEQERRRVCGLGHTRSDGNGDRARAVRM